MSDATVELQTNAAEQTRAMAAAMGPLCRPDDVIGLHGTLGAGKTCFVQGLARGLGVGAEHSVVSPTFVLLRQYPGRLTLYHFDAYRLSGPRELEQIGCEEVFRSGGVSVVEWADHVAGCLPPQHFMLGIRVTGTTRRRFTLAARGPGPRRRMPAVEQALEEWIR